MKSRFSLKLRSIALTTCFAFMLTLLMDSGLPALAASSATSSGNAVGQLGQIASSSSPVQSFQTDLYTGRAQTGVPIFVPPGRKNIQPSLNLSYSSSGGNGWLGMGWSLDMGFIQRDIKDGVPKYDSTDTYVFSYQGVYSELVSVGSDEYRAKDEALFLKFKYDSTNNKWTVTDKSGTEHTFGDAAANRQTNASGTFRWLLAKVEDTSGNYMTVTYTTDNGQLYLSKIEYNGNETQSFAHSHKVDFTIEDRTDDSFSYRTGAKVSTNKRLKTIEVKVKDNLGAYQLARKYSLAYEYSTATDRSRLITVTEYGKDGTTSLPATTFVYNDMPLTLASMSDMTGIQRLSAVDSYDYIRTTSTSGETVVDFLDVNGDGFNDRVQGGSGIANWKIQLGDGSSFAALTTFSTRHDPTSSDGYDFVAWRNSSDQQATDLLDIDGDGLPDRIIAQDDNTSWIVQINTGTGFESSNSSWGTISRMVANTNYDYIRYTPPYSTSGSQTLVDFFDMNGDGLPDRVMAEQGTNYWKVQLNTGSGFGSMQNWGNTERMVGDAVNDVIRASANGLQTIVDVADLNGDGFPDRIQADVSNTNWKVQWNTGSGFTTMENWGPIEERDTVDHREYIRDYASSGETLTDLFDVNGDGLPDRVQAATDNTVWKVQYNTGTGFTSMEDFGTISKMNTPAVFSFPRWVENGSGAQFIDVADADGDGLPDRVQSDSNNTAWKIQKNNGPFPDLLKEIKNGRGGKTAITYTASTAYDNTDSSGDERLPFPVQVVSKVDQHDGMGNTVTTNYSYKGGMYDATEREFRGFREVTVTDAAGTKTISTFAQDTCLKGRLLEKEVRDSSNNLFSKEVTTWDDTHPYTGVHFAFVDQIDSYIYDGDGTYKQTRQSFTYDSYGNTASITDEGEVGVSGDERKKVNAYVYNTTDYIVNTLKQTTLYDDDTGGSVVAERYFYYDGATAITTSPTAGLLTKEEKWLSTASGCGSPGVCANNPKTTMTYDNYGNIATVTDARSYTTTNTHDSTYHLFLIEIENALTHTREFTYDPWLAQILTSTDENGQVTETQYDVLGRVTKVINSMDSSSEPTQEFSYDYPNTSTCGTSCTTKTTTKVKSSVPGDTFTQLITYTFTDGLGREILRLSQAESGSQQIASGIITFNTRGLIDKQYVPYFVTAGTSYVTPDTNKPKATYTYDAVGRRIGITYPDATTSSVTYSDFVKTKTDQRGKSIIYTNDAYDRLVQVQEQSSGNTYTTTYTYDVLNNLKTTTDNESNVTTITYDSLSRKTQMVDLDMGTWTYTYDLNDNLATQVDAKSQTISFTYDALNRVTLKDLPSGETDISYSYDSAPATYTAQTGYWVGRLAKVSDSSGDHELLYDKEGRVLKDTKTISSTGYEFVRTYDSLGRIRTLTYPDTEVVTYTYNAFGDVETISGLKSAVTTDYVKDVDYDPSGQISFIEYGNDTTSTYTYDEDTLRLDSILTLKPDDTTKLQDLSYTFDNNGNVTQITDTVNSMSQTFTYDDLNRLTQAVGSAYGTQNFAYSSIGNMTTKGPLTMTYGEGDPGPHAVTTVAWSGTNAPTFCRDYASGECEMDYDANGNMTDRGGDELTYDSQNRLTQVKTREGESGTTNYTLNANSWNVISFTHLPDDKSITNVLDDLTFGTDYNQVSTWNSSTSEWEHWVNDPDFNDFSYFEHGRTYEIYVNAGTDQSMSVTGRTSGIDITHNIVSGDNFISPNVKTATNVTTVLSSLTYNTDYSDVRRFNATSQAWESYANSDFTQFEPGVGYNIVGLQAASFSYGITEKTSTFVYDSEGQRTKKVEDGTTTIYLGKDYDITGPTSQKYLYLGDRRIAQKDSAGTLEFIHGDHISSSNVITDSSGDEAALIEYDPYGLTVTHTGSSDPKHKFTGQEEDSVSTLYYYGARYVDSQLGRFIQPDWYVQKSSDPQSFNRYAYARNNPIKFTDPTGNFISLIVAWVVANATALAVASVALTIGSMIAAHNGNHKLAKGLGIAAMVTGALSIAGNIGGAGQPVLLGETRGPLYILKDGVLAEMGKKVTMHYGTTAINQASMAAAVTSNAFAAPQAFGDAAPAPKENQVVQEAITSRLKYDRSVYNNPGSAGLHLAKSKTVLESIYQKHISKPGRDDLGDAFRHSQASKEGAERVGPLTTYLAGVGYEVLGFFKPRSQTAWEYIKSARMDIHNNTEGIMAHLFNREIKVENLMTSPDG